MQSSFATAKRAGKRAARRGAEPLTSKGSKSMGLDAAICFKTRNGQDAVLFDSLDYSVIKADQGYRFGIIATHEVNITGRYYAPNYMRGNWPDISAVLMALLACPDIETVWYYGDCEGPLEGPFTVEMLHEYNAHYLANGAWARRDTIVE